MINSDVDRRRAMLSAQYSFDKIHALLAAMEQNKNNNSKNESTKDGDKVDGKMHRKKVFRNDPRSPLLATKAIVINLPLPEFATPVPIRRVPAFGSFGRRSNKIKAPGV